MSHNSGVIRLVISNRPRVTRSADLKLLVWLLPELYSTQSYYHYYYSTTINSKRRLHNCPNIKRMAIIHVGTIASKSVENFSDVILLDALRSSNTGNIFAQLVAQHCCVASWKVLLPVLPPSLSTCHATNFDVASCGNMLRKLDLSSTFCNKLSILSLASQLTTLHNTCDWSIFPHQKRGKEGEEARAWPWAYPRARSKYGRGCGGWECWDPRLWIY